MLLNFLFVRRKAVVEPNSGISATQFLHAEWLKVDRFEQVHPLQPITPLFFISGLNTTDYLERSTSNDDVRSRNFLIRAQG